MNILVVTGAFPTRSETFIYRKVLALAHRGHRVTVATRRTGDWSIFPDRLPSGIRVVELLPDHSLRDPRRALSALSGTAATSVRNLAAARRLYDRCLRDPATLDAPTKQFLRHLPFVTLRPDLAHFVFLSLGAMYPLARDVLGVPVIVSCRGSDLHTLELKDPKERIAALDALHRADAVHCVSEEMATEVARLSTRQSGVWVNRPAVDTRRIQPQNGPRKPGPVRLLASGRLIWKKGFDYLLAALARLARRGVDFEADILGEGELRSELRFSIDDLALGSRVRLVGGVTSSEVLARLQRSDIFVLSSVTEGISNAVLEAMASGVPVVTTDAGGMGEAVTDGVEGLVVPVRDIARFAEAIESLATNSDLRASMARAARERAVREFSIERQMDVFESMYRSVCGSKL